VGTACPAPSSRLRWWAACSDRFSTFGYCGWPTTGGKHAAPSRLPAWRQAAAGSKQHIPAGDALRNHRVRAAWRTCCFTNCCACPSRRRHQTYHVLCCRSGLVWYRKTSAASPALQDGGKTWRTVAAADGGGLVRGRTLCGETPASRVAEGGSSLYLRRGWLICLCWNQVTVCRVRRWRGERGAASGLRRRLFTRRAPERCSTRSASLGRLAWWPS